jgi:hypothetical protein
MRRVSLCSIFFLALGLICAGCSETGTVGIPPGSEGGVCDLNRACDAGLFCTGADICAAILDNDSDGVPNDRDNCVAVSNASQLDADGDSVGDVCDPCPNSSVDDPDGDGICEDLDNCPGVSNADQVDMDFDQLGDLCDPCPLQADVELGSNGLCPGFYLREVSWDFITSTLLICADYAGDASAYVGRVYNTRGEIPGTTIPIGTTSNLSQNLLDDQECYHSWGRGQLTEQDIDNVLNLYPDGTVPVHVVMRIGDDFSTAKYGEVVIDATQFVKINKLEDNHEYQVGVFQVVPSGYDMGSLNICLIKSAAWGGTGYLPYGVAEDCDARSNPMGDPAILVRSIPLTDVLYAEAPYTTIHDVTSNGAAEEDLSGSVNTYSLLHIGDWWEALLLKHGISDVETRLGKNPAFEVTLLGPYQSANTPTSNDHGEVKDFFKAAAAAVGEDLSSYDFVVYVLYEPAITGNSSFSRSFAAARSSYISFPLYADFVLFNKGFLSTVHEMGHQLFGGNDLYAGLGLLQYPQGVPDWNLNNLPFLQGCIMSKGFAWEAVSADAISTYYTDWWDSKYEGKGIGRFQTNDPSNFVLCVDTIVEIMNGTENPNCGVADFYSGACGECTSLDYLACSLP